MNKLSVSILTANFGMLAEELRTAELAGAHYAHIDVMDGHFVPNISIGVPVVESLRKHTALIFDVHLMISEPEKYVDAFAQAGADIINFHIEAAKDPKALIKKIKSLGKKAAITLSPKTPVETVFEFLPIIDMVLIMSVEPGFGNQKFLPNALTRARTLRTFIQANNLNVDIQMDGGIKHNNVNTVLSSGVNVVVAGSAIFGAANKTSAVKEFLETMKETI